VSFLRRFLNLFYRARMDRDIDAELKAHLEMRVEDNIVAGMSPGEARRDALLRFGNPTVIKEGVTAADAPLLLDTIWADTRYAVRRLRMSPGFTATAVLTLALGIGASTAIFSVANAVLLKPLPYPDPGRLVIASLEMHKRNVRDLPFSSADFIDLRDGTKAFFKDMAGVFTGPALVPREDGTSEQIEWALVTTNFFQVTGAKLELGRNFIAEDGIPQPPIAPSDTHGPETAPMPVMAILSHEYFERRYGGKAEVLGQVMRTTGGPGLVIVGVLAPHFRLYFPPESNVESAPDVWIANRLTYDAQQRNTFSVRPVGRLKDAVTLEQAQAATDQVAAQARRNFPIARTAEYHFRLQSMGRYLVAEVRPAILALMGSAIFLLLIACANIANLLLVRASLRERDLALRAAIGAGPWRLIRPILLEAFLLAAGGTSLALGLAWAGIHELRVLAPTNLPRLHSIQIDPVVLEFAGIAGLASAIIFGLAPTWRASRPQLVNALHGNMRNSGFVNGSKLRDLIVIAEVALSFSLLVGSGLMFRSFLRLQQIDPGFDSRHLLTFQVLGIGAIKKEPEERAALVREIEERLHAIAGARDVTASFPLPLTAKLTTIRWGTGEALGDPSKFQAADYQVVLPGYFETMKTPLIEGRTFADEDNIAGRKHIIIDEFLARKAFGPHSALGKRILIRLNTPEPEWVEVVGVVAHQLMSSFAEPGREQVYFTDGFVGSGGVRSWAIRTDTDAAGYENQVRAVIKGINPNLVVTEMQTMEAVVLNAQAGTRFSLLLIALFAGIAAALAGVGLYGVLSTAVRQRTPEIGVRMALGAGRASIFELVVGHGLRLSAFGIGVGIFAALMLTRVMSTMLVQVKPTDPATFVGMTFVFLAISAFASYLPARRAASLDPTTALRAE
jgi:predicted permease